MDTLTLAAYDRNAAAFVREWDEQPAPSDLQDLVRRFFSPGPTADVGCGGGRDAAWMTSAGYPATGYDASTGLIAEARRLHPEIGFMLSPLPDLPGVEESAFANVFCETVIMHLPTGDVGPSVRRMRAILRPGGTLYLSWRVTEGGDKRDDHGRLYAAFDPALVLEALTGADIVLDEQLTSISSGKTVRRIVAREPV